MTYLDEAILTKASPPQSQPLDNDQVPNSAGGFVYAVDDFARLRRFLILGSEGGSYYAGESKLTLENVDAVERCIAIDGIRTVAEIVAVSKEGRAPKNDQAILALALCIARGNDVTKRLALRKINEVARIGTHLFQLVEFLNKLGTLSGRAKRRALAEWYTEKTPDQAAYQAVKYRNRNGWTHRDVLRVAHPGSVSPVSDEHAKIFEWIAKGEDAIFSGHLPEIVRGFDQAQRSESPDQTAFLVNSYNLPREALKTEHLTDPVVWEALLEKEMPLTALIRNLGNMTRYGVLTPTSDATQEVIKRLNDAEGIKKARVHPLTILFALQTYKEGHGFRGTNTWTPVSKVVDALDGAFYKAFGNVEPTGKRIMLAIDISGSMTWDTIAGTNLMPRDGAGAMAMVTYAVEDRVEVTAFASAGGGYWNRWNDTDFDPDNGIAPVDISNAQRLDTVIDKINGMPAGGTDCALPMLWAQKNKREFDTFVIYTDSETWAGGVHPAKALKDYRKATGIDAKLIVVAMVSNGFSIADPKDPGMLDVVGFDTATPQIISDFSLGLI